MVRKSKPGPKRGAKPARASTHQAAARGELADIGARLRAFRIGRGMKPEMLADRLGISRAALYRTEKGEIPKIETLRRISEILGVSLTNLLGVGVEYIDTAMGFFERMRQLEEESDQIVGLFGPVSYLLTSDDYDRELRQALIESDRGDRGRGAAADVDRLLALLGARKRLHRSKRPLVVSLIAAGDLERYLLHGLAGRHDLPAKVSRARRLQARREAENIVQMLRSPPMGVEIGIVLEAVPATTFQLFRQPQRTIVAISPFRLGDQPNVRVGVALVTAAPDAVDLHEAISKRLWREALKGEEAARYLEEMIGRYGV
jgi:transcriptional regulator with XRE-family HTH domain